MFVIAFDKRRYVFEMRECSVQGAFDLNEKRMRERTIAILLAACSLASATANKVTSSHLIHISGKRVLPGAGGGRSSAAGEE